jgi:hypothetical protein
MVCPLVNPFPSLTTLPAYVKLAIDTIIIINRES